MNCICQNKKIGFTLAEVLITLGIIGVVAALTIPTLMHSTQEAEFKTGYRKAYSVISQALQKANNDNALTPFTGTNGGLGLKANFQAIEQYFSIAKSCDASHMSECWDTSSGSESYRNENGNGVGLSFIDKSGMAWKMRDIDADGSTPIILVDTNGSKKPNKYGQDRFPLFFSNTGNAYQSGSSGTGYLINGIPTKVIPNVDTLDNSSLTCPSATTHPCYYTSWLYN